MVNIEEFVSVIHHAVLRANQTLIEENLKMIGQYFEVLNPEALFDSEKWAQFEEVKDMKFDEVMAELEIALDEEQSPDEIRQKIQLLKTIKERDEEMRNLGAKLGKLNISEAESIRAKMITLQYPILKEGKVDALDIQVPLITLIPIALSELTEVRFKTQLEIETNEHTGEVKVSPEVGMFEDFYNLINPSLTETEKSPSSIEIIITPNKGPESLRLLVDGLEREFRAQLPH